MTSKTTTSKTGLRSRAAMTLLAVAALALAGEAATSGAFAQKAQFERNKPHVNVGTLGHGNADRPDGLTGNGPSVVDRPVVVPHPVVIYRNRLTLPPTRRLKAPVHHRPRALSRRR